jgi:hypothetical protein
MNNNINHSELLKATKKAVNSFVFNPSASKKQSCFEALASMVAFIEAIETPSESVEKPKASKSSKKSKTSTTKPKASKSASKTSRKAEIEAILTSGKKLKRSERSVLNKELHALLQEEKAALKPSKKAKKSSKKTVRRPKRTSANGLELAQAKTATANKVGKAVKTKVVHAITEGDAQPFEPRKEVQVVEPKVRKKAKMKLTLLPGESPEEAMARLRTEQLRSAQLKQELAEAEALIAADCPVFDELSF